MKIDYKAAGVDIAAGNEAVSRIKPMAQRTFGPQVLTGIGAFASLYSLKDAITGCADPVLVQSIDGVGTKTQIACRMGHYASLGEDVLSATANDIVVLGAKPLTLLDYLATDRLRPDIVEAIVRGMAEACIREGVALVGGETAEMPGTYCSGEHDVVGVITGIVDRNRIVNGERIKPGDVVLGLDSTGLHTNGYSLARRLFLEEARLDVDSYLPELQCTLGETLLVPHRNYTRPVLAQLDAGTDIHGMAHITGGGFIENIPRILPGGTAVEIRLGSWTVPPVFTMMQHLGKLTREDLYRTFNMGIGLVVILDDTMAQTFMAGMAAFPGYRAVPVGQVVAAVKPEVRFI